MLSAPRHIATFFHFRIIIILLLLVSGVLAAEKILLSPQKVLELVTTQSAVIRASKLEVEGEEYARKSALAALFPSLSVTGSYTRLDEPPTLSGFGSGEQTASPDSADTLILPPEYENWRSLIEFFDSLSSVQAEEQMNALFGTGPLQIAPQTVKSAGLKLTQPLFMGGKLWSSYRIAEYTHESRRLQHERTLQETGFGTLKLFWYYVLGREAYQAVNDERVWLEELVNNQTMLLENGMITELDLLQTKLALSRKKIDEISSQNEIREIGEQLLILLGLSPELTIEIDTNALWKEHDRFVYPTADTLEERILRRYDIRAMEYQVRIMERMKDIQRASYLPSIVGFYGVDYTNQYGMDESDFDDQWTVGVSLNWNIFDWGSSWRSMQKLTLHKKAAEMRLDLQRQQVVSAIKALVRTIDETRKKVEIAQEAVSVARRALEIARARYDQQMATNRDILDARKDLTNTRMAYSAARIELTLALEEYKIGPLLEK
ncbi:MAG: hypothetical protein GF401_06385 [Chitinivibrionales bacterium]|nr:hypothetical protein [Chitinivibrionales bacterium]